MGLRGKVGVVVGVQGVSNIGGKLRIFGVRGIKIVLVNQDSEQLKTGACVTWQYGMFRFQNDLCKADRKISLSLLRDLLGIANVVGQVKLTT